MSPAGRQAHFTAFLSGIGYHESAWRLANPADLCAATWATRGTRDLCARIVVAEH
jgi:hypothetical protein